MGSFIAAPDFITILSQTTTPWRDQSQWSDTHMGKPQNGSMQVTPMSQDSAGEEAAASISVHEHPEQHIMGERLQQRTMFTEKEKRDLT